MGLDGVRQVGDGMPRQAQGQASSRVRVRVLDLPGVRLGTGSRRWPSSASIAMPRRDPLRSAAGARGGLEEIRDNLTRLLGVYKGDRFFECKFVGRLVIRVSKLLDLAFGAFFFPDFGFVLELELRCWFVFEVEGGEVIGPCLAFLL